MGALNEVGAVQADAEAKRRPGDHIDQDHVADDEDHLEWVDVGARRHRPLPTLRRPVVVKLLQFWMLDRQHAAAGRAYSAASRRGRWPRNSATRARV